MVIEWRTTLKLAAVRRAVGLCIGAHCGKRVLYAAFSFSEPLTNEIPLDLFWH